MAKMDASPVKIMAFENVEKLSKSLLEFIIGTGSSFDVFFLQVLMSKLCSIYKSCNKIWMNMDQMMLKVKYELCFAFGRIFIVLNRLPVFSLPKTKRVPS